MSDSLGFLIADVSRLLRRTFDARVRAIGVTRPQWRVLTYLARNEGINQGGLADLLDVEPITASRMVDRLADAGLVERRADPGDRRAWRLYLTGRSARLMAELRPIAEGLFDDAMAGFDDGERQAFVDYLQRVRVNLAGPGEMRIVANG